MKTIVIANPAAGNGKAGERWPRIRKAVYKLMPSHTAVMTEEPGHATELARQAVRDGFQRILVYGGDGTVNEVVNGMFLGGKNLKKDIVLGIIPVAPSVGGDFCRSLGLNGKASQALDVILDNRTETIDIGRVSYADEQGHADERHFVNMAGMGLSNDVVSKVNKARRSKSLSASVAFKFSALTGKLNHVSNMMRIEIDGYRPVYETACSIHICNGRFAGGGMMFSPDSELNDGKLDLVMMRDFKAFHRMVESKALYTGEHVKNPAVKHYRGKELKISSDGHACLEVDGEPIGMLPARFQVLERSLNVLCPPHFGRKSTDAEEKKMRKQLVAARNAANRSLNPRKMAG